MEYGVYTYAFLMFFDKGDGVKNLSIYGAFAAFLAMVYITKDVGLSVRRNPLLYALAAVVFSTLASTVFSIRPLDSLLALKKEFWRGMMLFLIIAVAFSERMLRRLSFFFCLAGIVLLALGLHGYLTGKPGYYTSENILLHADKNKYAFIISFIFPFFLLFLSLSRKTSKRIFWGALSIWTISAAVLSASRGAMANVLAVGVIWAAFTMRREHLKYLAASLIAAAFVVSMTYSAWPEPVRKQITSTKEDIWSMNERVSYFWVPAFQSVAQRPILGWGYGKEVYRDPRPFNETEDQPKKKLRGGLHSEFVSVLFSQGIVGLSAFLFLLVSSVYVLIGIGKRERGQRRLLAVTLLSVMVGSFFFNAYVKVIPFRPIALILGMCVALSQAGPRADDGDG